MSTTPFDAGSEFGSPEEALQAELQSPTPAEVEAPEEPAEESVEDSGRASWEDQPQDADATPEGAAAKADGAAAPKTPAAPAILEVKGNKGVQKFELKPDNEVLKRTLQFGLAAPQWKKERDLANVRATEAEARVKPLAEKAKFQEEVGSLTQAGHYEQAARMALGEKGFDTLVETLVTEALEYAEANPQRRLEIERAREGRGRAYEKWQTQKQISSKDARLEELENGIETQRLESLGTVALKTHDFRRLIDDADLAHSMNEKLWKLAWTDLESLAEAGKDITPAAIDEAFKTNAKVLSSVVKRQTQATVAKVVETKKADAKAKAQVVATANYPKTDGPDLKGWDGKAKSLLRMMAAKKA